MSKQEFLERLQNGLHGLPKEDIDERLMFYSEMIDDRAEEGLSEEQAVSAVGDVEEIVRQVIADTPLAKIAKERIRPKRRLKAWEITLLAIGSPIWLSLGIAAAAVVLAIYVSVWSVVVSLWAVFVSLAASAAGSDTAQRLVKKLQDYITEYFYHCTDEILAGLGQMYVGDERFKNNIDKCGEDTVKFVSEAIKIYCTK